MPGDMSLSLGPFEVAVDFARDTDCVAVFEAETFHACGIGYEEVIAELDAINAADIHQEHLCAIVMNKGRRKGITLADVGIPVDEGHELSCRDLSYRLSLHDFHPCSMKSRV